MEPSIALLEFVKASYSYVLRWYKFLMIRPYKYSSFEYVQMCYKNTAIILYAAKGNVKVFLNSRLEY